MVVLADRISHIKIMLNGLYIFMAKTHWLEWWRVWHYLLFAEPEFKLSRSLCNTAEDISCGYQWAIQLTYCFFCLVISPNKCPVILEKKHFGNVMLSLYSSQVFVQLTCKGDDNISRSMFGQFQVKNHVSVWLGYQSARYTKKKKWTCQELILNWLWFTRSFWVNFYVIII